MNIYVTAAVAEAAGLKEAHNTALVSIKPPNLSFFGTFFVLMQKVNLFPGQHLLDGDLMAVSQLRPISRHCPQGAGGVVGG